MLSLRLVFDGPFELKVTLYQGSLLLKMVTSMLVTDVGYDVTNIIVTVENCSSFPGEE